MRGIGSAQVATAAEYLPGGQARRDGEETWVIDDCLGRTWTAIVGIDNVDAMFEGRTDRCVLISPLLAYEDMDDLLCLMGEVCSAMGVEGGPSCGIRVFADLGEGNPRAEANLRDLVFGKQELSNKVLETDVEAFRPRTKGGSDTSRQGVRAHARSSTAMLPRHSTPTRPRRPCSSLWPSQRRTQAKGESTRGMLTQKTNGTRSGDGCSRRGSLGTSTGPCEGDS